MSLAPYLHRLHTDFAPEFCADIDRAPIAHQGGIRKVRTSDVYEQACNITAWQQLYDQVRPGKFAGSIEEMWLDNVQLFKESTNLALRQTCVVWHDAIWFGLPCVKNNDSFVCASRVGDESIAVCPGGVEFELFTPDSLDIIGLVIPKKELENYPEYNAAQLNFLLSKNHAVHIGEAKKIAYLAWMREALALIENNPACLQSASVQKIIKHSLLSSVFDILQAAAPADSAKNCQQHYQRIVAKARDFLLSRPDETITILDLCAHLYVSRRTLQNAFQNVLNINPINYLKSLRLNAVRRELESSYSKHASICDAAAAWGFWHMSQFSVDYQRLFAERPSITLQRRGQVLRALLKNPHLLN